METKICNLDEIAPIQPRTLVINGVSHNVVPLSVGKFIEFSQMRQKIGKSENLKEGLDLSVRMIREAVPSLSENEIKSFPINRLQLILAFVNDEIPDEVLKGDKNKNNKEEEAKDNADQKGKE